MKLVFLGLTLCLLVVPQLIVGAPQAEPVKDPHQVHLSNHDLASEESNFLAGQVHNSAPFHDSAPFHEIVLNDIYRWFTLIEEYLLDYAERHILEGIIDKRTLKISIHFVANKVWKAFLASPLSKDFVWFANRIYTLP